MLLARAPHRRLAACIAVLLLGGPVAARADAAAEPSVFTLPADDGYGIGECMRGGGDCGRVMADSWCEAHGRGHALAFGAAEDVTGAIPGGDAASGGASQVIIRCGE